uniref:Receptor ligand binding region domain-containing protein n=1 Tax=Romanomermis culicivorax TaxID=13658 RepID=A0A915JK51_ROMCU
MLSYFNWTRVAFFYTDDKTTRKCYSAAQGAIKHLARAGIHIVLMHEIDGESPSDEEVDRFLDLFPALTRSKKSIFVVII